MNDLQSLRCDIALLPSKAQARLAAQASRAMAPQGSLFTLDNQVLYAHASLYMFQMNIGDQEGCITALRQIAEQTSIQKLERDGYFYKDSGHWKGYVDVSFARSSEIDELQKRVIAVFTKLRADREEPDSYLAVGDQFRPHITLTKFPAEIEPDLSVLPPVADFSGELPRIGLFELGWHGTCVRKLVEFSLH